MPKKIIKTSEFRCPPNSSPLIYSNTSGIGYGDHELIINFGLSTPSYYEPHKDEDILVGRVALSWDAAEALSLTLANTIKEHKKDSKGTIKKSKKAK